MLIITFNSHILFKVIHIWSELITLPLPFSKNITYITNRITKHTHSNYSHTYIKCSFSYILRCYISISNRCHCYNTKIEWTNLNYYNFNTYYVTKSASSIPYYLTHEFYVGSPVIPIKNHKQAQKWAAAKIV